MGAVQITHSCFTEAFVLKAAAVGNDESAESEAEQKKLSTLKPKV